MKPGFPVCPQFSPKKTNGVKPEIQCADRLALAGRLIYNVRVAGEWSDHLLTDAIPPFKSMFYSSNKLKASRTKKEIYQGLPNGLPICLKVYVFVHVLASFNLKSKHSALSIIQRSGLVHQSSVQISTYWACTLHRVVFANQLSCWT